MTFSGLNLAGGTNNTVEIYDLANAGAGWFAPTIAPFSPPLYPRLALLPSGKVFYTGQGSGGRNPNSWLFDPAAGTWTVFPGQPSASNQWGVTSASVSSERV